MIEAIDKLGKTQTTRFMVPMLGFKLSTFGELFLNAYISEIKESYMVYLVFAVGISDNLEATLKEHQCYIDSFSTDHLDYYIYGIPDEYEEDLVQILNGKYSNISEDLKTKTLKCALTTSYYRHKPTRESTIMYGILYKTELYRNYLENKLNVNIPKENELWEMFEKNEETINIDELELLFK